MPAFLSSKSDRRFFLGALPPPTSLCFEAEQDIFALSVLQCIGYLCCESVQTCNAIMVRRVGYRVLGQA